MALAWKAGWVQALAGSNPASSALVSTRKRRPDLTGPGGGFAAVVSVLVSVGLWPGPEEPADSARDLLRCCCVPGVVQARFSDAGPLQQRLPGVIVGVRLDRAAEPVCEDSARLRPELTSLSPLLILFEAGLEGGTFAP